MDMLSVTFLAVSKVIVSVMIGVVTTSSIPNSASTLRDFGFLISAVLLTSLTLSNTAQSVNLELLVRCSILILFSVLMIVWGLMWGVIASFFLFRRDPNLSDIPVELRKDVRLELLYEEEEVEAQSFGSPQGSPASAQPPAAKGKQKKNFVPYVAVVLSDHLREVGVDGSDIVPSLEAPGPSLEDTAGYVWAMWVGCSTQNGVTLPISLMTNIASSVDFIDFAQAAAYIFVFAISYMLYLWAAGPAFVEQGEKASRKQRLIRELITKHKRMTGRCDSTTQTLSFPVDHVLEDREETNVQREGNPLSGAHRGPRSDSGSGSDTSSTATAEADGNGHGISRATSTASISTGVQTSAKALGVQDTYHTSTAAAVSLPDAPSIMSPTTAGHYAFTMATAEQLPYNWQTAGFVRVKYEHDLKQMKKQTLSQRMTSLGHAAWGLGCKLMTSPPFLSVVVGMFIGVVTPVRNLFFEGGPFEMVMDAITLIGQGSIPSSLLLLGANLVGSATGGDEAASEEVRMRHAEQNTELPLHNKEWELLGESDRFVNWYESQHDTVEYEMHNSFSLQTLQQLGQGPTAYVVQPSGSGAMPPIPMYEEEDNAPPKNAIVASIQKMISLHGISKSFVWGVIGLRLIVAPAFSFVVLVLMIKTMPFLFGGHGTYDKTLIMVLLVELASPTAINSTLIFNARQFMTYPWAKMLFFQYVLCTLTMVMWSSLGLSYVSKL